MNQPIGLPCAWCKSTAPSHQQYGCGRAHCPFAPKTPVMVTLREWRELNYALNALAAK